MIVTHFRSRLRADLPPEYQEAAERLSALAAASPGLVEYKVFQAEDAERLTLVVFDSKEAREAWREHPEHRAAQQRGRERFYETYSIQSLETRGEVRSWQRPR